MEKCKSYEEKVEKEYFYCENNGSQVPYASWNRLQGYCRGTKEYNSCSCGGNPRKCNFYENIRKEANKMNTAEMWLKAQKDGKTYVSVNLIYNKSTGFIWDDNSDAEELNETWTRSSVLNEDGWELSSNIMTKEEAEKNFNIKIVG